MNKINQETSVGAFLYKIKDNDILFLLVYSKRNGEWGFPKGHIDSNESEIETAKREIKEETGITDIKFEQNFRCVDTYKIKGTLEVTKDRIIDKNVIYYLAKTNSNFIGCCDEEISEGKWLKYKQAVDCLKYDNQKKLLEKAYIFIKEENKK